MRRLAAVASAFVVFALALAVLASEVRAQVVRTEALPGGVQRTTYRLGPVAVTPGQNRIAFRPIDGASRPAVNGWISRIKPDLVNLDGSVPKSSQVMFHHGVWMNNTTGELFYATGEEKTILELPQGFGYRYRTNDVWVLNDMIHNLTPQPMNLYFEYTLDFIPNTAPEAASIVRSQPIWMDVQTGIYPVFDVWRDSGGADGEFTYPADDPNAYPPGVQKNVKTVPSDGMLIATTGHVHTGGLSTNLYLRRDGAGYAGPICPDRISYDAQLAPLRSSHQSFVSKINGLKKANKKKSGAQKKIVRTMKKRKNKAKAKRQIRKLKRQKKSNSKRITKLNRKKVANKTELDRVEALDAAERQKDAACRATQPQVDDGNRVHLFNSKAEYFDPRGPISWDMAMFSTDSAWRVRVKQGDRLELQTTYETKIASWPESMGINVVYWVRDAQLAEASNAPNPYETRVDTEGVLNHGHLPENEDYGGELPVVGPDPTTLPDGQQSGGPFTIADYFYNGADFRLPGALGRPPVVNQGQSFTFKLSEFDIQNEVWHSLTSCKAPCNKSTGISYPIPDGEFQFESGQMGPGVPPTVGYTQWSTPNTLPKGTYTFFCRIHPLMRGAFRVK
ncbi:MAG TPA: hypothetical protein PKD76_08705 [Solirubrobacterales bacterium]|nr:hypothetical protein [Solirubrobacterales bacterium]